MVKHPFLLVDKKDAKAHRFDKADQVAAFLWGRRIDRYIVIVNENTIVRLDSNEVRAIENQLNRLAA